MLDHKFKRAEGRLGKWIKMAILEILSMIIRMVVFLSEIGKPAQNPWQNSGSGNLVLSASGARSQILPDIFQ